MKDYLRQHIRACLHCLLSKTPTVVHLDHIGHFVTSKRGNKHVLMTVDNLTKFVRLDAVKSTDTKGIINKMEDFLLDFGAPERFITDRGRGFMSKKLEAFCRTHGIYHSVTSPRHAQANGQVEKVNRTLLPVIQANLLEQEHDRHWDKNLKRVAWSLNSAINKTTGRTAFEMLYGYNPRIGDGLLRQITIQEEATRY
ncbi:KRAB-A domain-containing protein 2-like [Diprion similis]|uniref:KRAB-A domain-containing protein 2-like n=1 Tax=Diprion similis TaxID=362088 RepID=UPI001EF7E34E|nr:KRAB-A domain-containing protein 2-like [Diprion similis]